MVPQGEVAKEVEINGVRLEYIEQGSGEPIVFVHGGVQDLRAWEPVREAVAKRYRFIAYPRDISEPNRGLTTERTSASQPTRTTSPSLSTHSMLDLFISSAGRTEA